MTFADQVLTFNKALKITAKLPKGVAVLNPFKDSGAFQLCTLFYKKYYNDTASRNLILGINPGRFGAGLTGIPFTDPIKLEEQCRIKNDMPKKAELSADFIYHMISNYGGLQKFYQRFYFSSVSPLGFVRDGKNLNYYDDRKLQQAISGFIINTIETQLQFCIKHDICFCLGEGKNYDFVSRLNDQHNFFKKIIPLPHPRFVMQYRRKRMQEFIHLYLDQLNRNSSVYT